MRQTLRRLASLSSYKQVWLCPHTIFKLRIGRTRSEWPVHASKAFRCATIQSIVPFRCITAKELAGNLVEISRVRGLMEDI